VTASRFTGSKSRIRKKVILLIVLACTLIFCHNENDKHISEYQNRQPDKLIYAPDQYVSTNIRQGQILTVQVCQSLHKEFVECP
jgi:hypothetical protein